MNRHTKKGPYGVPVCGCSNAHAQSSIWATFLPEASSRSLLCRRTAKTLARLRLCTVSPEPLLVAYVISNLFSCAGSIVVLLQKKKKKKLVGKLKLKLINKIYQVTVSRKTRIHVLLHQIHGTQVISLNLTVKAPCKTEAEDSLFIIIFQRH